MSAISSSFYAQSYLDFAVKLWIKGTLTSLQAKLAIVIAKSRIKIDMLWYDFKQAIFALKPKRNQIKTIKKE